jgi:putative transposase
MPWSLERFHNLGDLHFITFSCRRRAPLLSNPEARTIFVRALEAMRLRSVIDIHAYVVMPEHIHLLIGEPEHHSVASAIQGLKQATSHYIAPNQGALWEPRYYDFNVYSDRKRIEKLRYIHRNPVRRGLVTDPADWLWSSFRQYASRQPGVVTLLFEDS